MARIQKQDAYSILSTNRVLLRINHHTYKTMHYSKEMTLETKIILFTKNTLTFDLF